MWWPSVAYGNQHPPFVRVMPVFIQIHPLPGSEGAMSIADGQGHLHLGQDSAHMRRHVVRSFLDMIVDGVSVRHQPRQEAFKVGAYAGVGIFTDNQGGARMLQEQMAQSGLNPCISHYRMYLSGDVVGTASTRCLTNGFLVGHACGSVQGRTYAV